MNEHICATALYYLDSENITSSNLSFRMQTSMDLHLEPEYSVGQDSHSWMERIYGTTLGSENTAPCLQNYGSVETREGRLLAFPNVLWVQSLFMAKKCTETRNNSQHRVSPFELIDRTKPGHRRFIALWLVDPNRRIISTANVPPQQRDWWVEAILGSTPEMRKTAMSKIPPEILSLMEGEHQGRLHSDHDAINGEHPARKAWKLPPELTEMVRDYMENDPNASLMAQEEAKEHRRKLMEERGKFAKTSEAEWQAHWYTFCEH